MACPAGTRQCECSDHLPPFSLGTIRLSLTNYYVVSTVLVCSGFRATLTHRCETIECDTGSIFWAKVIRNYAVTLRFDKQLLRIKL